MWKVIKKKICKKQNEKKNNIKASLVKSDVDAAVNLLQRAGFFSTPHCFCIKVQTACYKPGIQLCLLPPVSGISSWFSSIFPPHPLGSRWQPLSPLQQRIWGSDGTCEIQAACFIMETWLGGSPVIRRTPLVSLTSWKSLMGLRGGGGRGWGGEEGLIGAGEEVGVPLHSYA